MEDEVVNAVAHMGGVTKCFGRLRALDGVSFGVTPGKVFALLGENGAGKTTAIRILLGLVLPDAGRAHVLGHDSARNGVEIRRRVGYVSERPALYEWMTVGEIGWFTSGFYPDGFLIEYGRLIEGFRLPKDRKIRALSKGMRAKVCLALALAHDPDLLILDEPTSGLDALVRREFLESMVDRAATGRTVFLSSHQIAEVERVADTVAILREGKLLLLEDLETLKREIREVTLTLSDAAPPGISQLPRVSGEILGERHLGRQVQVLVRGMPEGTEGTLGRDPSFTAVEVRTPTLEEIFIAYMERGAGVPGRADRQEADR